MESWTRANDWSAPQQRRARAEATIDQTLGDKWGSVTLSLVKERYWSQSQDMTSLSVSYNNSWHGVSYSLSYSVNKNSDDTDEDGKSISYDRQIGLNVSVPLDRWLPDTWANYSLNNGKDGTTHNLGLSGTALLGGAAGWGGGWRVWSWWGAWCWPASWWASGGASVPGWTSRCWAGRW